MFLTYVPGGMLDTSSVAPDCSSPLTYAGLTGEGPRGMNGLNDI